MLIEPAISNGRKYLRKNNCNINTYNILQQENSKVQLNEWSQVKTLFHVELQFLGLCSNLSD